MAESVGVSAGTVRNRIAYLEEHGVIRGYHPEIDCGRAAFEHHMFNVGRFPPPIDTRSPPMPWILPIS